MTTNNIHTKSLFFFQSLLECFGTFGTVRCLQLQYHFMDCYFCFRCCRQNTFCCVKLPICWQLVLQLFGLDILLYRKIGIVHAHLQPVPTTKTGRYANYTRQIRKVFVCNVIAGSCYTLISERQQQDTASSNNSTLTKKDIQQHKQYIKHGIYTMSKSYNLHI